MSEEMPNPYEVLGVERTAEAREIKRAYFTKVREFPPETHPEEFQRLRAAYELLSDAEARRRYDEAQADQGGFQTDPETSARLEQAVALHNEGNGPQARELLEQVLNEQPDLHVARDMMGMFLLREGFAEAALARFELLVKAQPREALYALHQGFALHNLERYGEAVDAYRRAKELDPRDVRIRVALADCLTDWNQLGAGLQEVDEAIAQVKEGAAPGDLRDFDLRLHRVELHLRGKAPWKATEAEVDRLFASLPETADAEMKRWAATKAGSLAAGLFANDRTEEANRLLTRCRQLHPESAVEVAYPPSVTLDVAALPEASQAWLAEQTGGPGGKSWAGALFLQALVLAASVALVAWAFLSRSARDLGDTLWVGTVLVLAALGLTLSTRYLLKVVTSRLGRFVSLHALYVVEVKWTRVTVWSLFNLRDIQLTNHSTNYAYTHTAVKVAFSKGSVVVNFNGEDVAKAWAQSVVNQRRRVLELLSRGLLEAEEGLDFVPARMLVSREEGFLARQKKRLEATPWRPYAGALATAAALCLLSVPINAARVDAREWGNVLRANTAAAARKYLAHHPSGAHAEQARALLASRYAEARAMLAERLHPETDAARALRDVVAALEAVGSTRVRYVHEVQRDLSPPANALDMERVLPQWLNASQRQRQGMLVGAVQRVLERAVGPDVARLYEGTAATSPEGEALPVTLVVREHTRLSEAYFPATPPWHALEVRWEVELRFEGEATPRHRFTVTPPPPPSLWVNAQVVTAELAYDELARVATGDFLTAWVEGWGLPGALDASAPPNTFATLSASSPYP
jgi:curved DNA-binding protein CbpA